MKASEFKKAITLLRDCENKIDFIVHLYDLVDESGKLEAEENATAEEAAIKKTGAKSEPKPDKAAAKKNWKPKKCIICGETFQPKNNRQMKCEKCKNLTVEEDVKNTAAELASMRGR